MLPDFLFRHLKSKTETFQLKMNEIRNLSKNVKNHPSTTLEVYGKQIDLHQEVRCREDYCKRRKLKIEAKMSKVKLAIIGNGMVGHRFIEDLLDKADKDQFEITVFCEEPRIAYDRVHLSSYFSHHTAEELSLVREGFYEKLYKYQCYCWYAFILQDFLLYYRYCQKWVDLFETEPKMIEIETKLKISRLTF